MTQNFAVACGDSVMRTLKSFLKQSGKHGEKSLAWVEGEILQMQALRDAPRPWIEANLWIRTKDRRIIRLLFNAAQVDYYEHRAPRDIILKPRQLGFTTVICALFFADCLLRPNTTSVLVAHDYESTERIFRIVQLFWERLPAQVKAEIGEPKYETRREFQWERLNSSFFVGTAGSTRFGHGLTINNLHCSEVSRWTHPEESLVALMEAVPKGGRIILESTANGMGNYFHDLWKAAEEGRSGFTRQFYVWWEDPTYSIPGPPLRDLTDDERRLEERWELTDDQIRWRREKQRDLGERFLEQYPEDPVRCFLASTRGCFDPGALSLMQQRVFAEPGPKSISTLPGKQEGLSLVIAPTRLLVWKEPEKGKSYVIGADVGEGLASGDASCAIVLDRQSGEQVAELHGRVDPARFGLLLDALGRAYNRAELAVERNNHGHSTLNTLLNTCNYPLLYYHVRYDQLGKAKPVLGWPTDQQTKPILVDDLAAAIAGGHILIHSSELVDECFSFITTDTGSQQAQEGKYDDRVMALGIAWQVRKRPAASYSSQRPLGW